MLFKILGSLLVIAASTLLGYVLSRDCSKRPGQLRELKAMLQMFENDITYLSSPLAEAFEKIGRPGAEKIGSIFRLTSEYLISREAVTASEAWERAVSEYSRHLSLTKEDLEILVSFGKMLGNSDLDGQVRNIRLALTQLSVQEKKAEDCRKKNEGMFRRLGILGGLAVVIILF